MTKISERLLQIQTKWKNNPNNWTILDPLCLRRQTRHFQFSFSSCTLLEQLRC